MIETDFLVIGGGIAGLSFALQSADAGETLVVLKKEVKDSASTKAQGGIAAAPDEEDFKLHVADTLKVGAGLCKEDIVYSILQEGAESIKKLLNLGAHFDILDDGSFHLHKEGGHSTRRVFHSADATGKEIVNTLISAVKKKNNITLMPKTFIIDLITTKKLGLPGTNTVLGAYALLQNGSVDIIKAKAVLIATGGSGKVYLYTSNPDVATGDGIAMGFRAGLPVANLEFMQFHPTCLYHPKAKNFLISEALRGEGAILMRTNGEQFMSQYDKRKELAPRDIVARAIDCELKKHGEEYVLLDISHKGKDFILRRFPYIYQNCLKFGYDITKEPIPVVPAAHYMCGGIITDAFGKTEINGLFAAGEVACTGLHGANRLASNSLLEGIVLGNRAGKIARKYLQSYTPIKAKIPQWKYYKAIPSDEEVVISHNWDEIRRYMWNYVGIVRTKKRLKRALDRSLLLKKEINEYYWNYLITPNLLELRNIALVSELIIHSAIKRDESRGLHFLLDNPFSKEAFKADTVIRAEDIAKC